MLKLALALYLLVNTALACSTKVSPSFEPFLARFEGVSSKVYNDHGYKVKKRGDRLIKPRQGHLTIGIGHLLTDTEIETNQIKISGTYVDISNGLTDKQIHDLLQQDVSRFYPIITNNVKTCLNQSQFDAITSFVFNLGYKAFFNNKKPNLVLKSLNSRKFDVAAKEMLRYNMSMGRVLRGLKLRRKAETELLLRGNYE